MRKALAKIVVFPKIDKIEVPDLKHAAQEEHDLIGELFTSLDDSGALTTLRLCSAVCARAAEAAERWVQHLVAWSAVATTGNGELDFGEVAEFVRDLTKAMMATKSGLDKKRVTQSGKATPNCLSTSERVLIAPMWADPAVFGDILIKVPQGWEMRWSNVPQLR
jgi:hypothetical protein